MVMIGIGCGGPIPSAPTPRNGFHTELQTYTHKPNPGAPVIDLGERVLSMEGTPVSEISLPRSLRAGNTLRFKGVIVHPDVRMIRGGLTARVTFSDGQGHEVIANEGSGSCVGKNGRLAFDFEFRLLKGSVPQHRIKLTFQGYLAGEKVDDPLEPWNVPIAEQIFELAE